MGMADVRGVDLNYQLPCPAQWELHRLKTDDVVVHAIVGMERRAAGPTAGEWESCRVPNLCGCFHLDAVNQPLCYVQ